MALNSRQDLADYALRALGAPVINIEIDDEQLSDAVENAIEIFHEYHSDGIIRDYVKHKFVFTKITLDDASLVVVGDKVQTSNSLAAVTRVEGDVITTKRNQGGGTWTVGDIVTFPGGSATITAVVLGDPDNGWIPIDEDIQGVNRILPWVPAFADGLFDITYQLRMNDLRNLSSGTMNYFTGTLEYLSLLDFLLRKEKQFRFNRRMNRLYIDMNWDEDIKEGTYAVIECHRALDDSEFTEVFNDPWLKEYTTAQVKRYWGANLRKYNGVSLPGGITLDGREIHNEAVGEIAALKDELINNMAPLNWVMG